MLWDAGCLISTAFSRRSKRFYLKLTQRMPGLWQWLSDWIIRSPQSIHPRELSDDGITSVRHSGNRSNIETKRPTSGDFSSRNCRHLDFLIRYMCYTIHRMCPLFPSALPRWTLSVKALHWLCTIRSITVVLDLFVFVSLFLLWRNLSVLYRLNNCQCHRQQHLKLPLWQAVRNVIVTT